MGSAPALEDAILLSGQAHLGQKDKAGQPYVLHALRVMFMLDSEEERIAGVLHDIVEQTEVTLDRLRSLGYSERIVQVVDQLTWRKQQESYEEYIRRLRSDPIAASVKRADIADHLTPSIDGRLTWLEKNHPELYRRYKEALSILGGWRVLGKDAFDPEAEMYLLGEYCTEPAALEAAYKRLKELEETQPTSQSGGQSPDGIQDRVYIQDPDGNVRRVMPPQAETT